MTNITREYYTVGAEEFSTAADAIKYAYEWVVRCNVDGACIQHVSYTGPAVQSDDWSDVGEITVIASVSLSGPPTLAQRLANNVRE